jgi:glutaredoxin 3
MKTAFRLFLFAALLLNLAALPVAASTGDQSPLRPPEAGKLKYPRIVIYTTSWCPYCKATKQYLTDNNIPFINKDVELDRNDMQALTEKYKSQGVPVIVIGNDEKVLKGFTPEKFEKAVREVQEKSR